MKLRKLPNRAMIRPRLRQRLPWPAQWSVATPDLSALSHPAQSGLTRLMGDGVEPRRDFIQENALNVANLDA